MHVPSEFGQLVEEQRPLVRERAPMSSDETVVNPALRPRSRGRGEHRCDRSRLIEGRFQTMEVRMWIAAERAARGPGW